MSEKLNDVLSAHGITLGLSNDDCYVGTWEWFEKSTEEFRAGFATEEEAYLSAVAYLKEEAGLDLPALDEDGELVRSDK